MKITTKALFVAAALICLIPAAAFAQITNFSQDFETLDAGNLDALGNDGWLVYANVFAGVDGSYMYGYGSFPAPNNPAAPAFSTIIGGQGGVEQGSQQLSIFSDYENAGAQEAGDIIEANFFREFIISSSDVGKTMTFEFQGKMGDLVAPCTALAFVKTLDPAAGYAETNFITEDMTAITTEWSGWSLSLAIDAGLVGQIFQVGFSSTCTLYAPSGIIYDNVVLTDDGGGPPPTGIDAYSQDFEALDAGNIEALGNDGWFVYANVFSGVTGDPMYGYGPNPAPNNPAAPAFCTITLGEGGIDQGAQQLSVFSDYENGGAQAAGDIIEAIVYREDVIEAVDVGKTMVFEFQGKMPAMGGVAAPSTATAFIKTIDPANSYAMTNYITEDMSAISSEWSGWSLTLTIDAGLVGQFFQIGFSSTATNYEPSAVIYDNVALYEATTPVPDAVEMFGSNLRQNYPNPFNPMTRIEFTLDKPGYVDLAVYDLAGRLVTNLLNENMTDGDHFVTWNGRNSSGTPAAAGQYHYVMKTAAGQVSRSMILLK